MSCAEEDQVVIVTSLGNRGMVCSRDYHIIRRALTGVRYQ
jgi:hypothetical protein